MPQTRTEMMFRMGNGKEDLKAMVADRLITSLSRDDADPSPLLHLPILSRKFLIDCLIDRVYEIFVEMFPKAKALIINFRRIIENCEWYGRERLMNKLTTEVHDRLLNIAMNTGDILKGYAAIVEGLALFDSSFVLVHRVCRPIRDYVKARSDTMKTIIKFITTDRPGNTANANKLAMILNEEQLTNVNDEYMIAIDDNADNRWMEWCPDPLDADPKESRLYRESADVFNMLISVYGSKDLFVKEYQQSLAKRLCGNSWGHHLSSEYVYLETMKKRFTERELDNCEVMLRDIYLSGKMSQETAFAMPFPVTAKIISSFYWPEFTSNSSITVHLAIKAALDDYEKIFKTKKPSRTIKWFFDFGSTVELQLNIGAITVDIEAPLVQVNVLLLFTQKEQWNLTELKMASGLDASALKSSLDGWCMRGVLERCGLDDTLVESFALTKSTTAMEKYFKQLDDQNDEEAGGFLSDNEDEEEEQIPLETQVEGLEQYWSYVKNFITFQKPTMERLTTLFKSMVSPGQPGPSTEAVAMFLQNKVRQNMLVLENGHYRVSAEAKTTA